MNYIFLLLIPLGLILLIISIKNIIRFANAQMLYEMSCVDREGVFRLDSRGQYSIWLSGKQLIKSPIGEFGIEIINQKTRKNIPLISNIFRTSVSASKIARVELYYFEAEAGTYIISMNDEVDIRDKISSFLVNTIIKSPVDYSLFFIQVREHFSTVILILYIWGIILSSFMIVGGIVLTLTLKQ
jgi:hypothetical protein